TPANALAATLSLSPATGTFNKNCPLNMDVILDTTGADTDGTDAIIIYDASRFTINSINTQSKVYPDYPGNNVDEASGKITISGLASVTQAFSGKGTLATLSMTVKEVAPTGTTQVKFDFDPNDKTKTTDSNVVQRGTVTDVLNSVVDGSYTIGTGTCGVSASPSPGTGTIATPAPRGSTTVSTPSAQPKTIPGTIDDAVGGKTGTVEFTAAVAIVGGILVILGILGLALL
ncbi:MAG: cohesin domain-containing protein, partial [Candidatus Daviesbacteria bacterium]|nr:cohesin domain-containing protein [Candidatus Daviesbacteria bacterium]